MGKKSGTTDPIAQEFSENFVYSYDKAMPYLMVMDQLQRQYDSEPVPGAWPTKSQVPVPVGFNTVQKSIANWKDRLTPFKVRFTPTDGEATETHVNKSENLLNRVMNREMRIPHYMNKTLRNVGKFGCGFGFIDTHYVTPAQASANFVIGKKKTAKGKSLGLGNPKIALRYRDVSPSQAIGYPDGTAFNGVDRCSIRFFVDFYLEAEFRAMMKREDMKGNVEEIIQTAKDGHFNTRTNINDMILRLAGQDKRTYRGAVTNHPVKIPVLKCYTDNRHLWIANAKTVIFDIENTIETLFCPIMIASPWADGDRMYPATPATTSRKLVTAYNYFYGCMLDVMAESYDPTKIYNSQMFPEGPPKNNKLIGAVGDVRSALSYLVHPGISADILQVGELMKRSHGEANNNPDFMNNPSAGLVRGGGFALGDLTRSITLIDAMVADTLKDGYINDIVTATMIVLQSSMGEDRIIPDVQIVNGERKFKAMTVTPDDFIHSFEYELDIEDSYAKTPQGKQSIEQFCLAAKDDPAFDAFQVRMKWAENNVGPDCARRLLPLSQKETNDKVDAARAAELQSGGAAGGPPTPPASLQNRLAGAGAAALGGA